MMQSKKKRSRGCAAVRRMIMVLLVVVTLGIVSLGGAMYRLSYENEVTLTTSGIVDGEVKHTRNVTRREAVVNAIQHAWRGYAHYALDADELMPLTLKGRNNWGHLQWTLVDVLDVLVMSNLTEEYDVARKQLESSSFAQNTVVSTFEATLRLLGGTLSAFEATQDNLFLLKALDIGDRLMGAFNTPSNIPTKQVHMLFGHPNFIGVLNPPRTQSLVGAGSVQMELSHLTKLTGMELYRKKGQEAIEALVKSKNKFDAQKGNIPRGLFPIPYDIDTGEVIGNDIVYLSMGSGADSFYEYLIKVFILQGGKDEKLLKMYVHAMDDMITTLIKEFDIHGTSAVIVIDKSGKNKLKQMSSLSCFIPGMLALGAEYGRKNNIPELQARYDAHMNVAQKLIKTCVYFYDMNPTGLSADSYEWTTYAAESLTPVTNNEGYKLRPETVESLFVLYRVTKNTLYRDQGWKIFKSIEKNCKTKEAYAAVDDVTVFPVVHNDKMESFFIAETLKYLLLLFSNDTVYPLDKFVFTTEGHPLPIH